MSHVVATRPGRSVAALVSTIVLLATLALSTTSGLCPANGNTHAIYVTSNMGDNIWSFDSQGRYVGDVLNKYSFPDDVTVDKLRSMRFGPGGHLYISSARGSYSRIFAVSGNGIANGTLPRNCTRNYLFTVAKQEPSNPFLDHPYDMVFHPDTHDLYVSNQNSITITRYTYGGLAEDTSDKKKGEWSLASGHYPTWKPSFNVKEAVMAGDSDSAVAQANAEGIELPSKIPNDSGLFASGWSSAYFMSSVRGIAISPMLPKSLVDGSAGPGFFNANNESVMRYLLVCDVASNTVHVFDPLSGERLFGLNVPSPIQVAFPARYEVPTESRVTREGVELRHYESPFVYVTSKEEGMTYMVHFTARLAAVLGGGNTQRGAQGENSNHGHRAYRVTAPTPLHASSGIYENANRDILLLADRTGRRINMYASPFLADYTSGTGPSPSLGSFARQLPDQPEFILSALLEHQSNIPVCYELTADGNFRYVALCTAAYIWTVIFTVLAVVIPTIFAYRQIRHCLIEHARSSAVGGGRDKASLAPLLGTSERNYGTA